MPISTNVVTGFAYDSVSANTTQATHAWAVSWQRRSKSYCHCNHGGPSGHRPAEHGNSPRSVEHGVWYNMIFAHFIPQDGYNSQKKSREALNAAFHSGDKTSKHLMCYYWPFLLHHDKKSNSLKNPMFHQHLRKTVIKFQSRSLPKLLYPTEDACRTCGRHDTQHPDAKAATTLVYIVTFSKHKLSLWRT